VRIPVATCRFQFNGDFQFEDAASLVPYLDRLGISDIYASPILKARQGSTHGYDVTDPTRLNPELGTEKDFDLLVEALHKHGMGLLLDIVPNHMAAVPENPWWWDVTEKGADSPFAGFFDTGWLDVAVPGGTSPGHRRFFDIGDLAGVRVEDPRVFAATHSLVLRMVAEGKVTGLRIDHIDGLYDPQEYLERLQRSSPPEMSSGFYVVVEKILSGDETFPGSWPVSGTTGYEFAKVLDSLFVDGSGITALNRMYSRITGPDTPFRDIVYEKKKQVMRELFPDETDALGRWLARLEGRLSAEEACRALMEVTACLPVYRTYIRGADVSADDRRYIDDAVKEAATRGACPEGDLDCLKRVLLLDLPPGAAGDDRNERLEFVRRWQQFTGAVMAKGYEDTALYNYLCLTSLNEVGGAPDTPGLSAEDFHRWNLARMKRWPDTLNAGSTHDTKRSEDVRAGICVLSEVPDEWEQHLCRWREWNAPKKLTVDGLPAPGPDTEQFLYQTMLGAWPLHQGEEPEFRERLKAYMIKAAREAKTITGWIKVNRKYEDALLDFIDAVLEESDDNVFLTDFRKFRERIAYYGALSSISRLLLRITVPGVPDFYRGTELWDFSLVDPDNRRPVDFRKRQQLLEAMALAEPSAGELLASWKDGRIKLYVTQKALHVRRDFPELFQRGDYIPLEAEGERRKHVCAFARRIGENWALTAVPRCFARLSEAGVAPVGEHVWRENVIRLPGDAPKRWRNALTGDTITGEKGLALAAVFHTFPAALLVSE